MTKLKKYVADDASTFDFEVTFGEDFAEIIGSGRSNPVDLARIRNLAIGTSVTAEDKLATMILVYWFITCGPKKPVLNGSTSQINEVRSALESADNRLNIKYKGDHIRKEDITPQRLMAACPEIAVMMQLKQTSSSYIVKGVPASLHPYFHPQVVSILPPDTDLSEKLYCLWASAKTSATLQKNGGASDEILLKIMEEQAVYFKLSFGNTLIPEKVKEKIYAKVGGMDVIATDKEFTAFMDANVDGIARVTVGM